MVPTSLFRLAIETPDNNFDFGYHHSLATAFDDITSSTKLCTGPLQFPPYLHYLTTHHTIRDLDNEILYPEFPGLEPTSTDLSHTRFGCRLVVPFQDSVGDWYSRPLATLELLCLYDVHHTCNTNPALVFSVNATLNNIIKFSLNL